MKKVYIVLDNIRSAYNVGSIFRSADGAGNCEILICGISPTPKHPKVEKTSLGSTKAIKWKYFKTALDSILYLNTKNIPIYSIELTSESIPYNSIEYPETVAIVLGHETEGINREILKISEKKISIPMRGKKESLNVATVAGIILYEIQK